MTDYPTAYVAADTGTWLDGTLIVLGDPDPRRGAFLASTCSLGAHEGEPGWGCDLANAREIVRRWNSEPELQARVRQLERLEEKRLLELDGHRAASMEHRRVRRSQREEIRELRAQINLLTGGRDD